MKLRHRLMHWLAGGDAVIMNVEFMPTGAIRTKELGDIFVHNVEIVRNEGLDYGVYAAEIIHHRQSAGISIELLNRHVSMSDVSIRSAHRRGH